MKKYFVVLSVAAILGLLAGMLAFSTVSADPIIGKHIQVPVIKVDDDWETWIHTFNKSQAYEDTGAVILFWGEYTGLCMGEEEPGPIAVSCRAIPWNGVWTQKDAIPAEAKSAIIYSVDAALLDDACADAHGSLGSLWGTYWLFDGWETLYAGTGEELAVVVDRKGPNDFDTVVSSAYTGISEEMEGEDSPYRYFAPYMMKGYNDLDTIMYIQNSGKFCGSVHINYQEQGICAFVYDEHIEQIAPGETYSTTVPAEIVGPDGWLGSAYIESNVPLGIIVDQTSLAPSADRGMLLSWRGQPYQPKEHGGEWDTELYGDLIFREWSGWNTSVQVQNLTKISQPTYVSVNFMDSSGDPTGVYLADWICPGGSQTFYMPMVYDLGFDYVGAVEIVSHSQIDWPGGQHDGAPIFAIIDLKNADRGQGGAYNAHPRFEKENAWDLSLPLVAKKHQNVTSLIALRNNSNCGKINAEIKFKNQEGLVVCIQPSIWLMPKQVYRFDLATIGCLWDNWVGAAEIQVRDYKEICDEETEGTGDYVMPSAVVVNRAPPGVIPLGDETRVYEAFPIRNYCIPQCFATLTGSVVTDEDPTEPIEGATVTVATDLWCGADWSDSTMTDDEGNFSLRVPAGDDLGGDEEWEVSAAKSGYLAVTALPVTLDASATVCDGEYAIPADIALRLGASISGVTFLEKTGDDPGVYNDPDEDEAGVTVTLYEAGTTNVVEHPDTGVDFITTSDGNGLYKFVGVPGGVDYDVGAVKGLWDGRTNVGVLTVPLEYTGVNIELD